MRTLFRLRTTDQGFSIILLESDTNIGLFFDTRGEKDTCVETVFELLLSVFGVDINTQYPEAFPDYYQPAYEDVNVSGLDTVHCISLWPTGTCGLLPIFQNLEQIGT